MMVAPVSPSKKAPARSKPMPGLGRNASEVAAEESEPQVSESDRRKAAFGFSMGEARPDTDDAAARAGVLAGGYKPTLHDPGMDRRAAETARNKAAAAPGTVLNEMFGVTPDMMPARVPSRQESAEDDAYIAAQMKPVEAAEARLGQARGEDEANRRAEMQLNALQRRQALIAAFEETTGQPFSEKALAEEMKKRYEAAEQDGIMADLYEMFEDERRDIEALGPGPSADREKALIREHYREKRDRLQNVRTNRAVQLSKQPTPPATDESIAAIVSAGGS